MENIDSITDISSLKNRPVFLNIDIGQNIIHYLESMERYPSLLFADPWGYKGLSCKLFQSTLKNWGCDCIFFFNYKRINPALSNPKVDECMTDLFGDNQAKKLRVELSELTDKFTREKCILDHITLALKEIGGEYVLPFRFVNETGNRTNHYLMFTSKNIKGYHIMKEIMADVSMKDASGVPLFEYNPYNQKQTSLFDRNLFENLIEELSIDFTGQKMSMKEIYDKHNVGKLYIKKNYKNALKVMEKRKIILADPPEKSRRKDTFADNVVVTFL